MMEQGQGNDGICSYLTKGLSQRHSSSW
jgi:hypothetical protein